MRFYKVPGIYLYLSGKIVIPFHQFGGELRPGKQLESSEIVKFSGLSNKNIYYQYRY
jgi:hypothetical protein